VSEKKLKFIHDEPDIFIAFRETRSNFSIHIEIELQQIKKGPEHLAPQDRSDSFNMKRKTINSLIAKYV
jgi:hypothetical protein